jgi:uncharacterized protein YqjF (DUF2071 family)
MNWDNLLFLHWRVDPAVMRTLVPRELEIDTYDGAAWIALVPFQMVHCHFRGVPRMPGLANFYECNVRTYVKHRGTTGVWFFSLDAQTLLPVLGGRWMWSLNYVYSTFNVKRDGDVTCYSLARRPGPWPAANTRISWRTGALMDLPDPRADPSTATQAPTQSLERFLTERYWLFTRRRGKICAGEVRHIPWPLRHAELLELDDTLIRAAGLQVTGAPIAMASEHIAVEGFALRAM